MGGKLSPIIIVAILVVVIVIALLIFGILNGNNTSSNNVGNSSVSETVKPVLSLEKEKIPEDTEPNKINSLTITATATMEDGGEITKIILPDGSSVAGNNATFEVTENKKYTFKVEAANGQTDSATIEVTEIAELSATNPYVPTGFSVINDNVDDGFVIADESGNQYVWVPVASGKLDRKTKLNGQYEESSTSATSLTNSVAKYYGFYIARFEASQYEIDGEVVAASMAGKVPWNNITYLDALNYADASAEKFKYEDCFTTLINSYAWDTVLDWIDSKEEYENYSSNTNYGNYDYTVLPTGTTEKDTVNNICDLAGNVREWTTEIYKDNITEKDSDNTRKRVVRGGGANLSRTPSSRIGYAENISDTYWGFRLILYKQ